MMMFFFVFRLKDKIHAREFIDQYMQGNFDYVLPAGQVLLCCTVLDDFICVSLMGCVIFKQTKIPFLFDDELSKLTSSPQHSGDSSVNNTGAADDAASNSSSGVGGVGIHVGVGGGEMMKGVPQRHVLKRGPHGGTVRFRAPEQMVTFSFCELVDACIYENVRAVHTSVGAWYQP